ncbi:uncharacterized protein LOC143200666 isoform X2 [Rhynchophorus ferrugineus]|uniref:uncharacterized protein LOC143200666 isoform X2 n=1 Tax=Rhynchophorus ferrugineus TaxID=354439 RepID=UPI003FCC4B1F
MQDFIAAQDAESFARAYRIHTGRRLRYYGDSDCDSDDSYECPEFPKFPDLTEEEMERLRPPPYTMEEIQRNLVVIGPKEPDLENATKLITVADNLSKLITKNKCYICTVTVTEFNKHYNCPEHCNSVLKWLNEELSKFMLYNEENIYLVYCVICNVPLEGTDYSKNHYEQQDHKQNIPKFCSYCFCTPIDMQAHVTGNGHQMKVMLFKKDQKTVLSKLHTLLDVNVSDLFQQNDKIDTEDWSIENKPRRAAEDIAAELKTLILSSKCLICNKNTIGRRTGHYKCNVHYKNVTEWLNRKLSEYLLSPEDNFKLIFCIQCNLPLQGTNNSKSHYISKSHIKNAKSFCEVCSKVAINTPEHILSKKHLHNLEKAVEKSQNNTHFDDKNFPALVESKTKQSKNVEAWQESQVSSCKKTYSDAVSVLTPSTLPDQCRRAQSKTVVASPQKSPNKSQLKTLQVTSQKATVQSSNPQSKITASPLKSNVQEEVEFLEVTYKRTSDRSSKAQAKTAVAANSPPKSPKKKQPKISQVTSEKTADQTSQAQSKTVVAANPPKSSNEKSQSKKQVTSKKKTGKSKKTKASTSVKNEIQSKNSQVTSAQPTDKSKETKAVVPPTSSNQSNDSQITSAQPTVLDQHRKIALILDTLRSLMTTRFCILCQKLVTQDFLSHYFLSPHSRRVEIWLTNIMKENKIKLDFYLSFCGACNEVLDGTMQSLQHYNSESHKKAANKYCMTCRKRTEDPLRHMRDEEHLKLNNLRTVANIQKRVAHSNMLTFQVIEKVKASLQDITTPVCSICSDGQDVNHLMTSQHVTNVRLWIQAKYNQPNVGHMPLYIFLQSVYCERCCIIPKEGDMSHYLGDEHKRVLYCPFCIRWFPSSHDLNAHNKSKKHIANLVIPNKFIGSPSEGLPEDLTNRNKVPAAGNVQLVVEVPTSSGSQGSDSKNGDIVKTLPKNSSIDVASNTKTKLKAEHDTGLSNTVATTNNVLDKATVTDEVSCPSKKKKRKKKKSKSVLKGNSPKPEPLDKIDVHKAVTASTFSSNESTPSKNSEDTDDRKSTSPLNKFIGSPSECLPEDLTNRNKVPATGNVQLVVEVPISSGSQGSDSKNGDNVKILPKNSSIDVAPNTKTKLKAEHDTGLSNTVATTNNVLDKATVTDEVSCPSKKKKKKKKKKKSKSVLKGNSPKPEPLDKIDVHKAVTASTSSSNESTPSKNSEDTDDRKSTSPLVRVSKDNSLVDTTLRHQGTNEHSLRTDNPDDTNVVENNVTESRAVSNGILESAKTDSSASYILPVSQNNLIAKNDTDLTGAVLEHATSISNSKPITLAENTDVLYCASIDLTKLDTLSPKKSENSFSSKDNIDVAGSRDNVEDFLYITLDNVDNSIETRTMVEHFLGTKVQIMNTNNPLSSSSLRSNVNSVTKEDDRREETQPASPAPQPKKPSQDQPSTGNLRTDIKNELMKLVHNIYGSNSIPQDLSLLLIKEINQSFSRNWSKWNVVSWFASKAGCENRQVVEALYNELVRFEKMLKSINSVRISLLLLENLTGIIMSGMSASHETGKGYLTLEELLSKINLYRETEDLQSRLDNFYYSFYDVNNISPSSAHHCVSEYNKYLEIFIEIYKKLPLDFVQEL